MVERGQGGDMVWVATTYVARLGIFAAGACTRPLLSST